MGGRGCGVLADPKSVTSSVHMEARIEVPKQLPHHPQPDSSQLRLPHYRHGYIVEPA